MNSEDKLRIEAKELLGELRGTLVALLEWKIPAKLKKLIYERLYELEDFKLTPTDKDKVDIIPFMDWFCQMYDVRKGVSKPLREEALKKDIELFKSKTLYQWDNYFKEQIKK